MSEAILTREEVERLWFEKMGHSIASGRMAADAQEFAAAIEAAVLEKACGEPVAWRAPNFSGSGERWAYRDTDDKFETVRGEPAGEPLYTLTRSKP